MAVRQHFGAYQSPAHVKLSSSTAPGRIPSSAPSPRTVSIPHGDAARHTRYLVTPKASVWLHKGVICHPRLGRRLSVVHEAPPLAVSESLRESQTCSGNPTDAEHSV